MSFDFATAGAELEAYIRPLVPQTWKLQDSGAPLGQTSGVVVTYTQGNATTTIDGKGLGDGSVAVDFVLIISTPETDPIKGFRHLNAEAVHLFAALDEHPQLLWETAERGVLQGGESIYLIPIQVIATYSTQE